MADAPGARPAPGIGRRLYRGIVFALIVGAAGAALGGAPALFLQSLFNEETQRCAEAVLDAEERGVEAPVCGDEFLAPPAWLPLSLLWGGAAVGAFGGLAYGIAAPGRRASPEREPQWLPF